MKLVIGNKNYSSWSLRPWLLLRHAGIAFDELMLSFNQPDFKQQVLRYSPAGRVPVLIDGEVTVWDSLAIAEYVAEKFPARRLWPLDVRQRAQARAICAEMHAGFGELRANLCMNVSARLPGLGWNLAVQRDIDRICAIWTGLRARHAADGPFLFGAFSVADAYYAPVVTRFQTYAPALPADVLAYMNTILALPAMVQWQAEAAQEHDFVEYDEPYRLNRAEVVAAGAAAPRAMA
jgi:glutathione S-transferase